MVDDIDTLRKQIIERNISMSGKEHRALATSNNLTKDIISLQYEKDKQILANNDGFKQISKNIISKSAEVNMQNDMLELLNQEQLNALTQYALDCERDKLRYRQKKEKLVILETVKAGIANKKAEALWTRYGYMYSDKSKFIPNKLHNKQKEFTNWWAGTNDNFKKVIKSTLKILLWAGIAVAIVMVGYRLLLWIANNTQNLPNLN